MLDDLISHKTRACLESRQLGKGCEANPGERGKKLMAALEIIEAQYVRQGCERCKERKVNENPSNTVSTTNLKCTLLCR